ncbi:MAG: alpha/beta fold hydrolase [Acidimicrobiales bacterium]
MDIILIAGLWLDASAWDDVVPRLRDLGHRPVAVSLPGQGAPAATATLGDQHAAVVAAVDAIAGPVMVVGHSAAATLAWMVADARPDAVARIVMIGGFPSGDGDAYADFFPLVGGVVPFPGWEPFDGPDSADLFEQQRAAIAARAIPVPEGVVKGIVHLGDDRRFDVPVTLVCPEFSPGQAKEWINGGESPELARAHHVDYVDIDSGHWPMFTRPTELADHLDRAANA